MNGALRIRLVLSALVLLSLPARPQGASTQVPGQLAPAAKPTISYTLSPDKLQKSEALYKLDQKFLILGTLYSGFVLLMVLYFGVGAKYRDWAEAAFRHSFLQAVIFAPLLLLTLDLADLPLRMYGHRVGLEYGLSVQNWASWFADFGKGEVLTILLLVPALWLMRNRIEKRPKSWWFQCWLIALPVMAFLFYIEPFVVEPLFNKYAPLESSNPKLVESIENLAQRAGVSIPRNRIYEMKASEKVTTLNAYVTGFGASKRIVIWDTTIKSAPPQETLFIVGHEMGHYVLHHVPYGLAAGAAGLLLGLYILYLAGGWVLRHMDQKWHIRALHDWAAFPMIFLIAGVMGFFAQPLGNGMSRYIEHQADIYGLEVTHGIIVDSQEVAAHSFQRLGELSLDYPYPNRFEVFWYWTHPTISDRVRFAQEYDPWDSGQEPKYVK